MKTIKDQLDASRASSGKARGAAATGVAKTPAVDPPERQVGWFSSYDEEWVAFVQEHAIRREHSGLGHGEPEALPRVWNCPHT